MTRAAPALVVRRATQLGLALALLWLLAASAQAAASDEAAQQAAQAAADVVDLHCADVAAGRTTEYAEALAAVTPVLAQVSRAYDKNRHTYLLYWRGLLSACVGQRERGVEDLQAFLAGAGDDPTYATQVRDARTQLRRLTGGSAGQTRARGRCPASSPGGSCWARAACSACSLAGRVKRVLTR